jgi:hypothetical protein
VSELELDNWTRKSLNTGLCGILDCFNKPTKQCKKCTNYYCTEHFPPHLDLIQDGTFDYSSSNAGLENYMHNEQEDFDSYEIIDDEMLV